MPQRLSFPRMRLRSVMLTVLSFGATGCYAYLAPPTGAPIPIGEQVRVALTLPGTTELARYLGPRVEAAEGQVVSVSDDTLVVAVRYVRMLDGARHGWSGEGTVAFPKTFIERVEQRTFQRRRTVIAATAATTGLVALAVTALRSGGAKGGPNGGGGPPPP